MIEVSYSKNSFTNVVGSYDTIVKGFSDSFEVILTKDIEVIPSDIWFSENISQIISVETDGSLTQFIKSCN